HPAGVFHRLLEGRFGLGVMTEAALARSNELPGVCEPCVVLELLELRDERFGLFAYPCRFAESRTVWSPPEVVESRAQLSASIPRCTRPRDGSFGSDPGSVVDSGPAECGGKLAEQVACRLLRKRRQSALVEPDRGIDLHSQRGALGCRPQVLPCIA